MEKILCYKLVEEPVKICESESDWLKFKNSLSDLNFINSICFLNEGNSDVAVSGTILQAGMYKTLTTPTPSGSIDITGIDVSFDGEATLRVILQRATNFYYKSIKTE
jgi:hypothetical protein